VSSNQALRRIAAAVGAALAIAACAGCSGGGGGFAAANVTPTSARPHVDPPAETAKPSVAIKTAPPVKIGKPAALTSDITVRVVEVRALKVPAHGPGEVAGPAVAVSVEVTNGSAAPFDLAGIVVNAFYGKGTPAVATSSGPVQPLKGAVAPGKGMRGSYVFMAPAKAVSSLKVEVSSDRAPMVVTFRR
jgi:hypothetical protein